MALRRETAELQVAFAAHLRNPALAAPPGLAEARVEVYRSLFFNNVANFLAQSFPVSESILGSRAWRLLCRAFYSRHCSHAPLFPELPQEFLKFIQAAPELVEAWPFLAELLHYEWVETALGYAEDELPARRTVESSEPLVLSPIALPLAYRFPVHKLSPSYLPTVLGDPSFLMAWRNRGDAVRFQILSASAVQLAARFQQGPQVADVCIAELSAALPAASQSEARASGLALIERWLAQDILLPAH